MILGPKTSQKTTINFWVMPNAGFATRQILQPSIQEFENSHPHIKVNLVVHPWSLAWNRVMDVIKGRYLGEVPDVIQVGTTHVATLVFLGALDQVPDSEIIPDEDANSTYIWDPGSESPSDKDLYCVPWFTDIRVLYYRKDVFQRLGIPKEWLHDWRGFSQVCFELQKFFKKASMYSKIIAPLAIPGQKPGVLMHDLAPWIWGAGGDFCSSDRDKSTFESPESLAGSQTYFDLIHQGFMPLPGTPLPSGNFFTGHFAMQFSGSWPGSTFLNPQSPYFQKEVAEGFDVSLFPAGPRGRYTFLGGSNLAVTSISKQKTAAWEFVRFLSNPKRQLEHAKSIGGLTARMASFDDIFGQYSDIKRVFVDSIGHARRLPRLVELGSIEQIIYKMSVRVLSQIRIGEYDHRILDQEIKTASRGISAVLSLHRYGSNNLSGAAK